MTTSIQSVPHGTRTVAEVSEERRKKECEAKADRTRFWLKVQTWIAFIAAFYLILTYSRSLLDTLAFLAVGKILLPGIAAGFSRKINNILEDK